MDRSACTYINICDTIHLNTSDLQRSDNSDRKYDRFTVKLFEELNFTEHGQHD